MFVSALGMATGFR